MIRIHKPRGSGRTTKLCELAKKNDALIITATEERADSLRRYHGVRAIGVADFIKSQAAKLPQNCDVYIDDGEEVLSRLLGVRVTALVTAQTEPLIEAVHQL